MSDPRWTWQCGERRLELAGRVAVMGIVNVTPDSFSDGGRHLDPAAAVEHALGLVEDGADILDVGGESTRPGAAPVGLDEELRRVVPVIERLRPQTEALISIDTSKAEVARAAVAAGGDIINDVTALAGDPAMPAMAAETGVGVVLMHMQGEPRTMQHQPAYVDVVREVADFLLERMASAETAGVRAGAIVLDPGIGFGKTFAHNLELYRRMGELAALPRPLLVGPSRRAFLGRLLDRPPEARLEGTAAACALAIAAGARVVRVHDVAEIVRVARVARALAPAGSGFPVIDSEGREC